MNQNLRSTSAEREAVAWAPLSRQSIWDAAAWAWHSSRLFSIVLVAVALILGAQLRFHALARFGMSADEGASWAGASAPNIHQVAVIEQQLDPGKLELYDVLLHGWIGVFGDSVVAMRAMSAALGTIAIVLVFVVVREVCRSLGEDGLGASIGELAGAFAALLYAANVQMVISDRTVRMYPLVMVAELLQIRFFVRAQRRGAFLDLGGIAIFTAAMLAANFTSSFLLISEVLWLECLLLVKEAGSRAGGLKILGPLAALIAGVMLLLPWLPAGLASSEHAVQAGFINWIALRPISWPYETLRSGAGSHVLFWILVALGGFGAWRQWYSARLVAALSSGMDNRADPGSNDHNVPHTFGRVRALCDHKLRWLVGVWRTRSSVGAQHRVARRARHIVHSFHDTSGA